MKTLKDTLNEYLNHIVVTDTMRTKINEIYEQMNYKYKIEGFSNVFLNEEYREDYNVIGFLNMESVFSYNISDGYLTIIPIKNRITELKITEEYFKNNQVNKDSNLKANLKIGASLYYMNAYRSNCNKLSLIIKEILIPNLAKDLL